MKRPIVKQTIPEPYTTLESLRTSVMALKELAETMSGQRGDSVDTAVTWRDLLDLGLIQKDQLPK